MTTVNQIENESAPPRLIEEVTNLVIGAFGTQDRIFLVTAVLMDTQEKHRKQGDQFGIAGILIEPTEKLLAILNAIKEGQL